MINHTFCILVLRVLLAFAAGFNSFKIVWAQLPLHRHHPAFWLAAAEFVAAVLFLIPKTIVAGGLTLLFLFGIAVVEHLLCGQWSVLTLCIYAAATLCVISAGNRG